MLIGCASAVNAQQKASDRTFAEEMRKVNEKKAARYAFISRMRQSTPIENPVAAPVNLNMNPEPGTRINPAPSAPNPAPVNLKASQQPMRISKKPVVIQQ